MQNIDSCGNDTRESCSSLFDWFPSRSTMQSSGRANLTAQTSCKLWIWSGAKTGIQKCANLIKSCRFRKILQEECFLANVGFDTAENRPRQVCCMLKARLRWSGIVSVPGVREVHFDCFDGGGPQRFYHGVAIAIHYWNIFWPTGGGCWLVGLYLNFGFLAVQVMARVPKCAP